MNAPCFFEEVINRQQNLWAITKRIPHPTGWGILFGMCRSTGELAASTCAKRVKSRGEAGLLRMATAIRGMPGSEFEPRRPLHKSPPIWVVIFFACSSALTVVSAGSQPLPRPAVGTLPRNRLASSAAGGASALSSSPAPKRIPHPTGWGILFGMCRSTGELAASTCAKRVKSRGEAGLLRMATAIRGMPGSEFEPRRPLHKSPPIWVVIFFACSSALTVVSAGSQPLPRPAVGTLPRNRLASSAAGGASALSSSERAS